MKWLDKFRIWNTVSLYEGGGIYRDTTRLRYIFFIVTLAFISLMSDILPKTRTGRKIAYVCCSVIIVVNVLFVVLLMFSGCHPVAPYQEIPHTITLDGRLPYDGVYHLTLDRTKWQTIHRITGRLDGELANEQKIHFESSHVWWFAPGDTVITIIRRNVNDSGYWVNVDTLHHISYDSMAVPTVNPTSYTESDGEFSVVIAPVLAMIGDTMTVQAQWYSDWYVSDTARRAIKFVLE